MSVKLLLYYINDVKKTHKKTHKTRSYARTFASNIWVLWQPPIGNVTPYFRGLVPYGMIFIVLLGILLLYNRTSKDKG